MKNTKSLLLLSVVICFFSLSIKAQNWSETIKIVPSDRSKSSYFGQSVDVYENFAVVGTPFDKLGANSGDPSLTNCGSAYILENVDGNWQIIQKICANDRVQQSKFGASVAIWGDYIAVGATGKSEASYNSLGVVYVFKNNAGVWTQVNKLLPSDPESYCGFGGSIDMENNKLVVGAENKKNGDNYNVGAAYVFELINDSWNFSQKLMASDCSAGDFFGYSVAISGEYIIAGAYAQDKNATGGGNLIDAGAAYIFKYNAGTWTQTQKLVANDRAQENYFGRAVDIDGDYAVISATYDSRNSSGVADKTHTGSVYVFKNNSGTWTQTQKIIANDRNKDDELGNAISIFNDKLVIGVAKQDYDSNGEDSVFNAGAVYVYEKVSNNWNFTQKLTASNRQTSDFFGNDLAIYNGQLLIGANQNKYDADENNYLASAGAVYVFNNSPKIEVFQEETLISNGGSFNFGEVGYSGDGLELNFKIKNSGGTTLNLTGNPIITLASGDVNIFIINQNNVQPSVLPNQETSFTIKFKPTSLGNFSAQISIASDCPSDNPYVVNLQGVGGKSSQTITGFADIPTKTYGDANFQVSAVASSGLNVVFTSSNNDVATCSGTNGSTITIVGAGECQIYANQAGNDNYYPAPQVAKTLKVNKKVINVTANALSKYYGNDDPELTYSYTPQLVDGDSFSGNLLRITGEAVGSYPINQGNLGLSDNYTLIYTSNNLQILQRPITVTVVPGQSKVYKAAEPTSFSYTYSGGLIGSDDFSGFLTREPGDTVGTYDILQNNLSLTNNYQITFISNVFTINPRHITITANSDQNKTYGQADPTSFTYTLSEVLYSGNTVSGALDRVEGEDAGEYEITVGTLAITSNYTFTYQSANFEIFPKDITIIAHQNQSKLYGDPDPVLTYQLIGSLIVGDSISGALSREEGEALGSYPITQGTLSAGDNYTIQFTSKDFEIKKKSVLVTPNSNQSKEYGFPDQELEFTCEPAIAPWDNFEGALSREEGELMGTYAITKGNLGLNSNYILFFTTGVTFEITPRTINVTIDPNQNKTYGEADPPLTYSYTPDLVDGDSFQGFLYREPGNNVGEYEIFHDYLQLTYNYILNIVETNKFNILPREITVNANAASKTYGNNDPYEFSYSVEGELVPNDYFTGELEREPGEDAGIYQILADNFSINNISNYTLIYNPANFTILPRQITVKATEGLSKIYGEQDPEFTYSVTSGNIINNDEFSGELTREDGDDVGTYEILQGELSLGNNYNINYQPSQFEILKATPEIYWENPADIYTNQALSEIQLNASSNIDGNFTYTPDFGTYLPEGNNQALHALFNPTDNHNYNQAEKTVYINVLLGTNLANNIYSQLSVYPNPTKGMIYFNKENQENVYLRIYDSNAKLVYDNYYSENYFDLSNFISGTYVFEITQNGKTYIEKVVLF
ncbi:MAG TPA: MBG domain-containing protein [Bacteroidales bacterium]|nr:MBG domain-containing protein [Bacteroidales bacterium]HPL03858.1 MBG domain-containing protein [Bacteroidales bacterium]